MSSLACLVLKFPTCGTNKGLSYVLVPTLVTWFSITFLKSFKANNSPMFSQFLLQIYFLYEAPKQFKDLIHD